MPIDDAPASRAMVSPVDEPIARSSGQRARRRVTVLLTAAVVLLLAGLVAANADASPRPQQPTPIPPVDSCEPDSPQPVCQWPSTPTPAPSPTNQLPLPTELPVPTTGCVPGQIGCTPPTTATTSTTPCEGEDCIPQPTTPPPGPGGPDQGDETGAEDPDCGLTEIAGCMAVGINSIFRGLVEAALSPLLKLLAATALSTPTIDQIPGLGDLWDSSWQLVVAVFGLLVLIGGIVVMTHESLQTRYSIKEIGPRIPVAFLASTLSLFFTDKMIRLANALSTALLGDGVDPPDLGDTLGDAVNGALTGGLFLILVALVLVVIGIGLLIVYVIRVVITLLLVIAGPLLLMFHSLPHTDGLARWWWKAMATVLAIQVAQSLVLITAVKMLLAGGIYLLSSFGALGMLIGAIALFVILFKIPFWFFGAVKVGSGGSLLGGLAKAYVATKTFGMISGRATAGRAVAARAAAAPASTPAPSALSPTPPVAPTRTSRTGTDAPRLRDQYDTERTQAARRVRRPAHAPTFLQPGRQVTTHDPAVDLTAATPAAPPKFSSAPDSATPAKRHQPASQPLFQTAQRQRPSRPASQPIRVASVPPALRFQSASPDPDHHAPVPTPVPTSAPVFRSPRPEPRIGDARRRTPSVPPITFRAPPPSREGQTP